MTIALLDDHLLRDLLADRISPALDEILTDHQPATTNLYLYRLSKSVVAARGGALTGAWTPERRRALGARLLEVSPDIEIAPMRSLTFRMSEIAASHRVSTLGAEAVAAAEAANAPLCVWAGDSGPGISTAMETLGLDYLTIDR